jgi:hypothetical protein
MSQPLDLDQIEARRAAVSKGPWRLSEDFNDIHNAEGDHLASYWHTADGEFIVHAPEDIDAMAAEIRRLRAELATERAPFHLHSATAIADADDPTPLRWGLNDVMWGDDDSVTVLLSGPDGEPYWLELDPERAAVLRQDLAGPDSADD